MALLLAAAGVGFALIGSTYGVGSLRRLGPGLFPLWLGWGLAGLATIAAIGAIANRGREVTLEISGMIWTILGVLGFALVLETLGLLPATFVMVGCISMGNGSLHFLRDGGTAAGLTLFGYLLFDRLLGVPVSLLNGWI